MTRYLVSLLALASMAFVSTGCGSSAKAKLQFAKSGASASARIGGETAAVGDYVALSSLNVKLIAAYLTEDIDATTQSNVGNTQMFYLNSDCADDISNCDLSGASHNVSSFFDFSSPSATNSALNAQGREIDAGEYRYVRLEFCKGSPATENIKYTVTGTSTEIAVKQAQCTINSAKIDPPLSVEEGKSVTITLSYDTSAIVKQSSTGGTVPASCGEVGGNRYCLQSLNFTPSAAVE